MASKRKRTASDNVEEIIDSVSQADEVLTQLREKCSAIEEIILNAEQEAITIVSDAAQRIEAMTKESEKGLKSTKKELADVKEEIQAMQSELKNWEDEKKRRTEIMTADLAKEREEWEDEKKRRTEIMTADLAKERDEWEDEKKRIANTHAFEPMVTLNVGGKLFTTATATLTRFPDTMLGAMFSGRHALTQDKDGAYCIDRDGRYFHEILNFLRGTAGSTQKMIEARLSPEAMEELKVEADFYGVKDLMFPTTTVSITGATGPKADLINGTYQKTTELSGGMPVYAKVGNSDVWLVYLTPSDEWCLQKTASKGSDTCYAYCEVTHKCLPHKCPAGEWPVYEPKNKDFHDQPAIAVNRTK